MAEVACIFILLPQGYRKEIKTTMQLSAPAPLHTMQQFIVIRLSINLWRWSAYCFRS